MYLAHAFGVLAYRMKSYLLTQRTTESNMSDHRQEKTPLCRDLEMPQHIEAKSSADEDLDMAPHIEAKSSAGGDLEPPRDIEAKAPSSTDMNILDMSDDKHQATPLSVDSDRKYSTDMDGTTPRTRERVRCCFGRPLGRQHFVPTPLAIR